MADALIPVGKIYEGFWIDWTRNRLLGCTLTLCPTSTTVLTNSLAMWVTLCGIQLWTIIRYNLHQRGSLLQIEARTPQLSGQQVILRNAGSALSTAQLMFGWAWNTRDSTGRRSKRAYTIALFAAVYYIMFTVAGMFSNNLIIAPRMNSGSAVLLRSPYCGVWNQTIYNIVEEQQVDNAHEFDMFVQNAAKKAYELQLSLEYAQECYLTSKATIDLSSTCKSLKQTSLHQNHFSTVSCPFAPEMCLENPETMVFDTGDLDSHTDFGINSIPQDRLKYQRVTECAVLNSTYYVDGWNGTIASPSGTKPLPEAAHANYGPNLQRGTTWTYSYSNFASFYDNYSVDATTPYQVGIQQALAPSDPQWVESDFDPIQELAQKTADITLAFLGFTGMYLGQVDDPWFLARNKHDINSPSPLLQERYSRDTAISTLGCKEQHKFCTNDNVCTDLLGFNQIQNNASFNAILTPHQNATFDRMLRAIDQSRLHYIIRLLAATNVPLLAAQGTFDGNSGATLSSPLPVDQWKHELQRWHSISMAQLQRTVARWATGQVAADPAYLLKATSPQDIWFCNSLIVPSAVYTSFSVFAIMSIVFIGCLIIFAGLYIERLASLLRRCLRRSAPKRPWNRDDMIELQRRKTVASRWTSPKTGLNVISDAASRHSNTPRTVDTRLPTSMASCYAANSQSNPQWQYARFAHASPGLASSLNRQARPQAATQPTRESWMTISLCSVESNSPRRPPKTKSLDDTISGRGRASNLVPAAMPPYSDAAAAWGSAPTQYSKWI